MNSVIQSLPVLVLFPHNRCNCRCLMCDIWKRTGAEEISVEDLQRHLNDFERLSVRWVVLSGGEPLMHSDLFRFCRLLRERNIRITILSTGLLFDRHAEQIVDHIDDAVVSLDGPPAIHDRIRRVPGAFASLIAGIEAIHRLRSSFPVSARSVVQRENYRYLRGTARSAKELGLQSISFLAADLTSEAFNRPQGWNIDRQSQIALSFGDLPYLAAEIEALADEWEDTGFVLEDREKLRRIVLHYRAHLGLAEPVAPVCNAPWVSAVVEADGTVRPCFFHRPIGRLNGTGLLQVLNGPEAVAFRSQLNVAANPVCRRCVCSLNWKPGNE